jgi:hypothetical protein
LRQYRARFGHGELRPLLVAEFTSSAKSIPAIFKDDSYHTALLDFGNMSTTDLSYPIGRFQPGNQNRRMILLDIADTPGRLRDAIEGLSEVQLDAPYRPGGWTVRQVVHHLADSHMHSYIRTKFALTQNEPTIMPYDENVWAGLKDAKSGPLESSLLVLEGLHARWVQLLESIPEEDWKRMFNHPERGLLSLETNTAIYAWHGRHHTAHITELRRREGWV